MEKAKNTIPFKNIIVAIGCLYRFVRSYENDAEEGHYEFLLSKRYDSSLNELDNKWELPGGKVENGEDPNQTVEREFLEETGYKVEVEQQIERYFSYIRQYPDVQLKVTLICYLCKLKSEERSAVKLDKKVGESKWFALENIDFRKTLQGSREFLIEVSNILNIEFRPNFEKCTYLVKFIVPPESPSANSRLGLKYSLTIQFNTNNSQYYLISWRGGEIHFSEQLMVEEFTSYTEMISKAKKRIRDRHYHGYYLCYYDEDFPLLNWINQRKFPRINIQSKNRTIQPSFIFDTKKCHGSEGN